MLCQISMPWFVEGILKITGVLLYLGLFIRVFTDHMKVLNLK